MRQIKFVKMHGLANDFVIIDLTKEMHLVDETFVKSIANRKTGVGCDQVILLNKSDKSDICMTIFNSDGSKAEACGNATRCVAKYICDNKNLKSCTIEFSGKVSRCKQIAESFSCTMGKPSMDWSTIPLSKKMNCLELDYNILGLPKPSAVNVGNPHVVFFVENIEAISIDQLGPKIEYDSLFPKKVNVSFAQILNEDSVLLRVWERGVGKTESCGTAACATAYAAIKRNLVRGGRIKILFNHGNLIINLLKNDELEMIGDANLVFTGQFFL